MRDKDGRHVIFHGVNIVYKVAPFLPDQQTFDSQASLTDKDIDDLVKWGFNMVRLGVMWEAVESAPGVYNETYLAEVDALITKLGERGIYTLVDAHQDVLARIICGEGMPNFYAKEILEHGSFCFSQSEDWWLKPLLPNLGCTNMDSYNFTMDSDGNPLISECQERNFFDYYASPQGLTLFRAFYDNNFGMQDKYVAYWAKVAQSLSTNKFVMGFDPFNEPYPSWTGVKQAVAQMVFRTFDHSSLEPLYARIFEKYMEVDKESIMFFEPGQCPDITTILGTGIVFNVGFSTPPGAKKGSPNHVLNDHTYCCQLGGMCSNGEPDPLSSNECIAWHDQRIGTRTANANLLGVPFFLSEFGACMDSYACEVEITNVGDVADKYLTGWAYWEFKPFHDLTTSAGNKSEGFYNTDGSLQVRKVKALARTYVKAAQGTIKSVSFPTEPPLYKAGNFTAVISIDSRVKAPTVIHTLVESEDETVWYPNGYEIEVKPAEFKY